EEITCPTEAAGARSVYHLFVVRTPRRDELLAHLKDKHIGAGIHYPVPVHRQGAYLRRGIAAVSLPVTERAASEILSLPLYPELTDEQIARVADAVKEAGVRC